MPNGNLVAGHSYGYRKPVKMSVAEKIFAVPFAVCFTVVAISMWVWGPIVFRKQRKS